MVPPLSPEELLFRAELAGYARVIAKGNGRASLRFTRVLKGRPRGTGWLAGVLGLWRPVTVRTRSYPLKPVLGDWGDEDAYVVGGKVLMHLTWDESGGCYDTVWFNGVERIAF
ncbi:hypothetical protein [Mesorhizobium loti]|uniref:hypothetical protein n=1 Tax=Rhizobium loti TaxID=381 RepID=UPI0003F77606|nr:hypothetical protein [Mesorhizobium loti]